MIRKCWEIFEVWFLFSFPQTFEVNVVIEQIVLWKVFVAATLFVGTAAAAAAWWPLFFLYDFGIFIAWSVLLTTRVFLWWAWFPVTFRWRFSRTFSSTSAPVGRWRWRTAFTRTGSRSCTRSASSTSWSLWAYRFASAAFLLSSTELIIFRIWIFRSVFVFDYTSLVVASSIPFKEERESRHSVNLCSVVSKDELGWCCKINTY